MAEKGKNFDWQGSVLNYRVADQGAVSLDLAKLSPEIIQKIVQFGLPTLLRNATAGLLNDDPKAALERVKARAENFAAGIWRSVSAASAEPRTSMLARAVALAGIKENDKAAADWISDVIEAAIKAAGLNADAEEDEEACRKIGNAMRKKIAETKEVQPVLLRLKREAAEAREKAATEKAAEAPSINSLGL